MPSLRHEKSFKYSGHFVITTLLVAPQTLTLCRNFGRYVMLCNFEKSNKRFVLSSFFFFFRDVAKKTLVKGSFTFVYLSRWWKRKVCVCGKAFRSSEREREKKNFKEKTKEDGKNSNSRGRERRQARSRRISKTAVVFADARNQIFFFPSPLLYLA